MKAASTRRAGRLQRGLLAALFGVAVVAWLVTGIRMAGMDGGPGTDPGTLGFYLGAWVLMMAAMMFPSAAPMVLTVAHIQERRRARGADDRAVSTSLFVAGYVAVWTAFGLAAYVLMTGTRAISPGFLAWDRAGPYVAGGVIVAAALYQLTPAKDACLTRCRSPLGFVLDHWQDGAAGAVRMGTIHGAWCVGCCWALMAALFALGVMSIAWMVLIAVLIAGEKLLPWKRAANAGVAVVLLTLGLGVAFAPARVPGLTMPDPNAGQPAMSSMHAR